MTMEFDRRLMHPPHTENVDPLIRLALNGIYAEQGVELQFAPVHDLIRGSVSTFFCTPVFNAGDTEAAHGYHAFQHIGPRDLPPLDSAILRHAVRFQQRLESEGIAAAVGTPVNFETLSWSGGRRTYLDALRAADTAHSRNLILKIDDVPPGTADSRLAEMVAAVRPYVRRVFVHLSENDSRLVGAGHIGAAGFVASLPPKATRPVIMAVAKSLARTCDMQLAVGCIDNVAEPDALEMARAIGIRFAAGTAFGPEIFRYDTPGMAIHEIVKVPQSRGAATRAGSGDEVPALLN